MSQRHGYCNTQKKFLKNNAKAEIFCKIFSCVAEIEMETSNIDNPKLSKQMEVLDWTPTTLVDKKWELKP